MKTLEEHIYERLQLNRDRVNENTQKSIIKKIYRAFGLKEQDDFTQAIDKWVKDNNIVNVNFYVHDMESLQDMHMPKSVIKMYSDDADTIKEIDKIISSTKIKKLASDEQGFELIGNSELLAFISDYGDSLYTYVS